MKRIFFAAFVAALTSVSANAADMAYKSAPMAEAAYNWTGFYIGANGGGGIAGSDHLDPDCFTCASTKFQAAFGTVGVGGGYNYQFGHSVIGVEGDYNWASVDKTKFFALDRTFIYATAGVAFAHVQNTTLLGSAAVPAVIRDQASEDKWKAGLAVGGGVEFAVTQNWTVKGEYLYMKFEDSEASVLDVQGGGPTCRFNVNCRMNYSVSVQTARLGVNYWFGY